jgi:hypothetical protein
MEENIKLAIVNITSWAGQCSDATHVYGHLILCDKDDVNINNIEEYNVKYLGKNIELKRPLTLEIAQVLDEKDGNRTYQRHFRMMQEEPEYCKTLDGYGETDRFDTFPQVVDAGLKLYHEMELTCPFISLYEGVMYKSNKHENSNSVILFT